jgi:hypothetical protein
MISIRLGVIRKISSNNETMVSCGSRLYGEGGKRVTPDCVYDLNAYTTDLLISVREGGTPPSWMTKTL